MFDNEKYKNKKYILLFDALKHIYLLEQNKQLFNEYYIVFQERDIQFIV